MSPPRDEQILFRCGGATWARYGVPWRRLRFDPRESERPAHSRPDATSCARRFTASGLSIVDAANVPRFDHVDLNGDGVLETPTTLHEGSRENVVLHCRDLTNAAWVKSGGGGVSAAKDQTGIDGVANSASRITATGANGTCLQAITLASSARAQTVYIKRLVGAGTIEMTMDNGATWTAVAVTTAWTRVSIPTQTLANPTVGFRIVTNADSVAIDFVQNENGVFPSSAIATTAAAVTRAGEGLTYSLGLHYPDTCTVLVSLARPAHADAAGDLGDLAEIFGWGGSGDAGHTLGAYYAQASRLVVGEISAGSVVSASQAIPAGASQQYAFQFKDLLTAPKVATDVGPGYGAFSSASSINLASAPTLPVLRVGWQFGGHQLYGGLVDLLLAEGLFTRADILAVA